MSVKWAPWAPWSTPCYYLYFNYFSDIFVGSDLNLGTEWSCCGHPCRWIKKYDVRCESTPLVQFIEWVELVGHEYAYLGTSYRMPDISRWKRTVVIRQRTRATRGCPVQPMNQTNLPRYVITSWLAVKSRIRCTLVIKLFITLHSRLNTWLKWTEQRQLWGETKTLKF